MPFGGLSAATWAMPGGGRRTADVLAPMPAIAVGVPDEAARTLHPGREAGLADLAADAAGAVIAAMPLAAARRALRRADRHAGDARTGRRFGAARDAAASGRDPSGPGLGFRPR